MEKTEITCHAELLSRILYLKSERLRQEEDLKRSFKDFAFNFDPASMMRGSMNERAQERNVLFKLVKVGLNMASNFVIDQVLGKRRSFKGFLSSLLVEEFSALLINSNIVKIISLANGLLFSDTKNKKTE
jgi:hypothetical protein